MTDYFLYVLYLSNGTFYIGQTSDPHRRIHDHSHGRGSFYTNRSQHHTLVALIQHCQFSFLSVQRKADRHGQIDPAFAACSPGKAAAVPRA